MIIVRMKKVKAFFHVFSKSAFPQPAYYHKIRKVDFWFSLKYFVVLIFGLNVLFFAIFLTTPSPRPFADVSLSEVSNALQSFPKDLTITLKNGSLSTNYSRPYFLWGQQGEEKILLAVVSKTATSQNVQDFQDAKIIFTNREAVIFRNNLDKSNPMILPYGQINLNITKQTVNDWLTTYNRLLPWLTTLFILFIFIITPLFATLGAFIQLIVLALFCWLIFALYSKKHNYSKTLQISLHAATVPYLVKYGLLAFGYDLVGVAWPIFAFLMVIFVLSALYEAYFDK